MAVDRAKQLNRQNNWITEKYDRINLTVPKGKKEELKEFLNQQGKGESVNAYINRLIDEDVERVRKQKAKSVIDDIASAIDGSKYVSDSRQKSKPHPDYDNDPCINDIDSIDY